MQKTPLLLSTFLSLTYVWFWFYYGSVDQLRLKVVANLESDFLEQDMESCPLIDFIKSCMYVWEPKR